MYDWYSGGNEISSKIKTKRIVLNNFWHLSTGVSMAQCLWIFMKCTKYTYEHTFNSELCIWLHIIDCSRSFSTRWPFFSVLYTSRTSQQQRKRRRRRNYQKLHQRRSQKYAPKSIDKNRCRSTDITFCVHFFVGKAKKFVQSLQHIWNYNVNTKIKRNFITSFQLVKLQRINNVRL